MHDKKKKEEEEEERKGKKSTAAGEVTNLQMQVETEKQLKYKINRKQ